MSRSKKSNPNEFRSKWDMPHKEVNDYKRSKIRKDLKKEVEEYKIYKQEDKYNEYDELEEIEIQKCPMCKKVWLKYDEDICEKCQNDVNEEITRHIAEL